MSPLPDDKTLRLFQWAMVFFGIAAVAQSVVACIRLYLLLNSEEFTP